MILVLTAHVAIAAAGATGAEAPLWRTGMETGSLVAWTSPSRTSSGDTGGGEFDSGGGFAAATSEQRHSGDYAAKLELPDGRGGARLFRWRELRQRRDVAVTIWLYFPRVYTVVGRFFDVFQFKSRTASDAVDPIWFLDVRNPARGRMRLDLIWWHRSLKGPWPKRSGFRRFKQTVADIPVGRWFRIRAELLQSSAFDGFLRIWQDDRPLFDMTGVRTSYANCAFNVWCTSNEWSVNNYSDGLRPRAAVIYADDAAIEPLPLGTGSSW